MKKILSFLFLSTILGVFLITPVLAQDGSVGTTTNTSNSGSTQLYNPLGSTNSIQSVIGRAINSLLGIVGSLALLMFVYGGLMWMTSAGASDKVKKGKDIILWSAVGLVVIFSAYALTKFVITALTK